MTKEEISKAIEECEEKLKNLRDELNRPEYGGKRWKPKKGESYLYTNAYGEAHAIIWCGCNLDKALYATGSVFPSEEAVKLEFERRKVIAELSDYAEGDDAVWDRKQDHFQLYYNHFTKRIEWDRNQFFKFGGLYFSSPEAAKAAVEAVGEDRVKKYYLGVKG